MTIHTLDPKTIPIRTMLVAASAFVLCAGAAVADSLVVYSPQGGDRAVWIAQQAQAAGHDIAILNAGGGELFDRLIAEKNNPQADVVFGLVDTSMALLKREGLFQAYVPSWADELPDQYRDADGMVHKFWQTPIVLAYNADALSEADAPQGWLDLTDPAYRGKYVIGNLAWQTTRVYLAGILVRFLDERGEVAAEGWDFMRDLYAHAIVVNDGSAKAQAFQSGDAVIDLNWFGGAFRQASQLGYTVELVDTDGGTPFISEGIAIMAGTDQRAEAKAFVDWFGSPAFMGAYAEQFGQAPVHPAALALSPDSVQEDAALVSPQAIDWDTVATKLDAWLQTIELEIR